MGFRDERLRHWVWCDEKGCRTGERWWKLSLIWGGVATGLNVAEEAEEMVEGDKVAQTAVTCRIRRAPVSWTMALETDGIIPLWVQDDADDAHDWVEVAQGW